MKFLFSSLCIALVVGSSFSQASSHVYEGGNMQRRLRGGGRRLACSPTSEECRTFIMSISSSTNGWFSLIDQCDESTAMANLAINETLVPLDQSAYLPIDSKYTLTVNGKVGFSLGYNDIVLEEGAVSGEYISTFGTCPFASDGDDLELAVHAYLSGGTEKDEIVAQYGEIGEWDVSRVVNFDFLFSTSNHANAAYFNDDISGWETSSAGKMTATFQGASAFNQSLSGWSTGGVDNFNKMFFGATSFEGAGLEEWDVSAGLRFKQMFKGATAFKADLSGWQPNAARTMHQMFQRASSMTTNICGWNNNVDALDRLNVDGMFNGATGCADLDDYNTQGWDDADNNYDAGAGAMNYLCGRCP